MNLLSLRLYNALINRNVCFIESTNIKEIMSDKNLKAHYLFEASWEVCNKIGGIHTVLSTKALTLLKEFDDRLIFIGPDVWRGEKIGKPIAVLVDFTTFIPEKDKLLAKYWELYQVDSISGSWDYVESLLFGYAVGKVVESFYNHHLGMEDNVVANFHEWMTGSGALYLKEYAPQIATVFTTHATTVGRSIAGNGMPLYDHINEYDGDAKARDLGVISKHSLEKNSAIHSDCYTTVSEITARECNQFFGKEVGVITPNGFEDSFVPKGEEFDAKRDEARYKLRAVADS